MTVKYFLSKTLIKQKISFLVQIIGHPILVQKNSKNSFKPIFDNVRRKNKDLYLVGDCNINVLDFENNVKVKTFVNFVFPNNLTILINKPTKITRTNATAIDHILTNIFLNKQIKMGIFKTEISDYFPIFLITDPITLSEVKNKTKVLYKRTINTATKENFKNILARNNWDLLKKLTILMKPIANCCMVFPLFMRKFFQN